MCNSRFFFSSPFQCRVQYAGYSVTRPEGDTGKYKSIPHHHRGEVQFLGRQVIIITFKEPVTLTKFTICTGLPGAIKGQ